VVEKDLHCVSEDTKGKPRSSETLTSFLVALQKLSSAIGGNARCSAILCKRVGWLARIPHGSSSVDGLQAQAYSKVSIEKRYVSLKDSHTVCPRCSPHSKKMQGSAGRSY